MVHQLKVAGPEPEPSLQGGQDRNQAPEDFGVHVAEVGGYEVALLRRHGRLSQPQRCDFDSGRSAFLIIDVA